MNVQLWRTILCVLRRLLLACAAKIPEHDLAVVASTCQHGLFKRMPRQRGDGIIVGLECMQLGFQVAQIPQANGLISRTGGQNSLRGWVKCDGVDCVAVTTLCRCS